MIRKIIDFKFNNRVYKVWDITVGDYMLFLDKPGEAMGKILKEFNGKIPAYLWDKEINIITNTLFDFLQDDKKKTMTKEEKEKAEKEAKDKGSESLIESIAFYKHFYPSNTDDILAMPLRWFIGMINYIPKIQGGETEDEKNQPDKKGIKEAMKKVNLPIDKHK